MWRIILLLVFVLSGCATARDKQTAEEIHFLVVQKNAEILKNCLDGCLDRPDKECCIEEKMRIEQERAQCLKDCKEKSCMICSYLGTS